jgi:hypothetical protein
MLLLMLVWANLQGKNRIIVGRSKAAVQAFLEKRPDEIRLHLIPALP